MALCNELYVGDVPDVLKDLTVIEKAMIARRRAKACILHLQENYDDKEQNSNGPKGRGVKNGTVQRGLRGRFIMFLSYPERVTNILPATMDDMIKYICVLFVGPVKPSQKWLKEKAKLLLVWREKVRAALE